jgi:hypothetical protein
LGITTENWQLRTIVSRFIEVAKSGQLAPAKYLFEALGLYPSPAETLAKPENSLAYALLKRMGLPTSAIVCEEDPMVVAMASATKSATREASEAGADSGGEKGRNQQPDEGRSESEGSPRRP